MEIDYVRMTTIPKFGETKIERISEAEACAIRNNVFMRTGNVRISGIENGYEINDSSGQTLIVAVFKQENVGDSKNV